MLHKTTKVWKLKVLWTNGSELQFSLKNSKESNPVDIAEFVKARGLEKEPALRREILLKIIYKYSIEIPTSIEDAKRLNANNGKNFWV